MRSKMDYIGLEICTVVIGDSAWGLISKSPHHLIAPPAKALAPRERLPELSRGTAGAVLRDWVYKFPYSTSIHVSVMMPK